MFTGIVEEAGRVVHVTETEQGIRLVVKGHVAHQGTRIGDSVAVNGCCLTAVQIEAEELTFDLLRETWERTNLRWAAPGARVNLERSMAADGRIHGHFVTGHIDGTGEIDCLERRGSDWYLKVVTPSELLKYIAFKGAIAIDGISLTVAEVHDNGFAVWIIPHTYAVTALSDRKSGSAVNLEADLIAKYVQRLLIT